MKNMKFAVKVIAAALVILVSYQTIIVKSDAYKGSDDLDCEISEQVPEQPQETPQETPQEQPQETPQEQPQETSEPEVVYVDREVEVPVYVDREVIVEKEVEVPVEKTVYVDREVEVPVEKIVYVDREVEVPATSEETSEEGSETSEEIQTQNEAPAPAAPAAPAVQEAPKQNGEVLSNWDEGSTGDVRTYVLIGAAILCGVLGLKKLF